MRGKLQRGQAYPISRGEVQDLRSVAFAMDSCMPSETKLVRLVL